MLLDFFDHLRHGGVPVSVREYLDLLTALDARLAVVDMEDFYCLSRAVMVKDERHYDRFDRSFDEYFKGIEALDEVVAMMIPDEWLRAQLDKDLSDEERQALEEAGGIDNLIEEFKKRWAEQRERHEGGNRMIGTGGTSPFGNNGDSSKGIRVGGDGEGKGKGEKSWQQRMYRNLDDQVELGTRNIKMALRRLRRFARTGNPDQLDLPNTIRKTANNGGIINIEMMAERRNAVKVLVFFDIGGSMEPHVKVCEELFSACRTEFKHLEYFYFHNFIYETVWKDNRRRTQERIDTLDILHRYPSDYRVIFVGDAAMAPYEITNPGGSIEHWNEDAGMVWLQRLMDTYPRFAWLNPTAKDHWEYSASIEITNKLTEGRMFPMTLGGLDECMTELTK